MRTKNSLEAIAGMVIFPMVILTLELYGVIGGNHWLQFAYALVSMHVGRLAGQWVANYLGDSEMLKDGIR